MLRVFYGENRERAQAEIRRALGTDYEVFEGENLTVADLPSIFQGTSLFATEQRRILLKNVSENATVFAKLPDYAATEHLVIDWEMKLDKRLAGTKALTAAGVELKEFAMPKPDTRAVFAIFDLALRDGKRAVTEVEKIEGEQDAFQFLGLLATQAIRLFEETNGGMRAQEIIAILAETDQKMKSSPVEPWELVKAALIRLSRP